MSAQDGPRRRRTMTRAELVAGIVLGGLAMTFLFALFYGIERRGRTLCATNLRQLGLVLALYANENYDLYPPLDERPGNLMLDGNRLFPEYVSDINVFGCPADSRFDPHRSFRLARITEHHAGYEVGDAHGDCIDSTSYMYLGYSIANDDDLRVFRHALEAGEEFRDVAVAIDEDGWPSRAQPRVLGASDAARPVFALGLAAKLVHVDEVEQLDWPFSAHYAARGWNTVPLIWERPPTESAERSHWPAGQHVLYEDGQLQYVRLGEQTDRFPFSRYSRAWLKAQVPAPSGNPADTWGDCP